MRLSLATTEVQYAHEVLMCGSAYGAPKDGVRYPVDMRTTWGNVIGHGGWYTSNASIGVNANGAIVLLQAAHGATCGGCLTCGAKTA
ncbi:hypothetical protein HanIR_Chr17g0895691 [Helianthus annuus]|nr:hypothetical protein HanIR_Chr17g0895691 [Helianthus annuus]